MSAVVSSDQAVQIGHRGGAGTEVGARLNRIITDLYPICRSITGNGFRQTLGYLQKHIPLEMREVPTGTKVFDWVVPREWNIADAWIKNAQGERVVDFRKSNLHVVNYSLPIRRRMGLAELKEHLFSLPEQPDWIPYRTTYYRDAWGFCLSHRQLLSLRDEEYDVCIDSTLQDGHLTYGEYYLRGSTDDEVLISCHTCHPSLCNDNLSGVAVATLLARELTSLRPRLSYRFLWIPGTIGSITWLALNEKSVGRIRHGLVLSCLGDSGKITYKRSRRHHSEIDRAVALVLQQSGADHAILDFSPYGYDERQYCSPGFNLPVGCLMRTPNGKFPEYHTSADNLEFVRESSLADSFAKLTGVVQVLEANRTLLNQNPKCEPRLGERGLYRAVGGAAGQNTFEMALLWLLNFSDGDHDLISIAERSGIDFKSLEKAADSLVSHGLLKPVGTPRKGRLPVGKSHSVGTNRKRSQSST